MIPQRRGAGDATIARLEVRAERADPLAARLAVERMLGAIELRPDGLPPAAILCVRELRDPRPGTISLASRQLRPPAVWEQAVRREVERMARAAARPAHGAVPAAAEAVVFGDESELLACLASDVVARTVGTRWWWRLLVEGVEQPRRAAARAWLRAPEHAPAALHALAARREAEAFVQLLEDGDVHALVAAIARAFALPAVAAEAGAQRRPSLADAWTAPNPAPLAARSAEPDAEDAGPPLDTLEPAQPWSAVVPEADRAALSIEQRVLLGVALTIARAPALARSPGFTAGLAAWRAAAASSPRQPMATGPERVSWLAPLAPAIAPASMGPPPRGEQPSTPVVHALPPDDAAARWVAGALGPTTSRQAEGRISHEPAAHPAGAAGQGVLPLSASAPDLRGTDAAQPSAWSAMAGDAAPAAEPPRGSPAPPRRQPATRARSRAFGPPIRTRLGGLFYLVNLALYLQLYGDEDNLSLSPWDLVALVGRALLGEAVVADDLLWTLLAELAGRTADDPPGADFVPPTEWRLPPAWLAPFEPAALASASGDRLVISHLDGFVIVDVAARDDLASQLAAELAPYGIAGAAAGGLPLALPDAPIDRWLGWLVPYLRARLRRVLAVDDAGLPARLLAHAARVHVTDTHVDVVLPLDALPIEIRIAGLDRDPGWVPAAGRFLAFHFE